MPIDDALSNQFIRNADFWIHDYWILNTSALHDYGYSQT